MMRSRQQVIEHNRRVMAMNGLGDLPPEHSVPRGENEPLPPYGIPPRGGASGVLQDGSIAPTTFDQSDWNYITFNANIEPSKIQDFTLRKFLLIQNRNLVGTMYIGFGYIPTPLTGLVLLPQTGYEPFRYPTNEIYVTASQDGVVGLLLFGT